jgi:hypothetical protein
MLYASFPYSGKKSSSLEFFRLHYYIPADSDPALIFLNVAGLGKAGFTIKGKLHIVIVFRSYFSAN